MVPGPPSTGVAIAMDGGMADTACYFLFHDLRIRRVQHNAVDCLITESRGVTAHGVLRRGVTAHGVLRR